MPVRIDLNKVEVAADLRTTLNALAPALIDKMTFLMTKLQNKARSKVRGRVAEAIRNPRAEVQGSTIVGLLDWGGVDVSYGGGRTFDLTQIIEKGAKAHVIYPLKETGTRGHQAKAAGGGRRFGKDVLAFYSENLGKKAFANYVFHPGVQATHFMENSIDEMKITFAEEILQTIRGFRKQ